MTVDKTAMLQHCQRLVVRHVHLKPNKFRMCSVIIACIRFRSIVVGWNCQTVEPMTARSFLALHWFKLMYLTYLGNQSIFTFDAEGTLVCYAKYFDKNKLYLKIIQTRYTKNILVDLCKMCENSVI